MLRRDVDALRFLALLFVGFNAVDRRAADFHHDGDAASPAPLQRETPHTHTRTHTPEAPLLVYFRL